MEQIKGDILESFPEADKVEAEALLAQAVAEDSRKIIVLDDDPTGVQTVHDVSVYTDWSVECIRQGFMEENKMFYILTNSRGFTEKQTIQAHTEIAKRVDLVARETGRDYMIINRGDSTLRGHFPLETEVIKGVLEAENPWKMDGEIICPYFREGGRFTFNNTHYVKYDNVLVPAGETEFARDKTFGYQSSDLRAYVEEKTRGAYKADQVVCISIEELRSMDIEGITAKLMAVTDFNKVIVNAVDNIDVEIFAIALYRALAMGKRFLYRTAAAFVKAVGNISDKPLLTRQEMVVKETTNGGIIVVGSHTQKTTLQLEALKTLEGIEFVEMNSDLVLIPGALEQEVERIVRLSEARIAAGISVAIYTKRQLLVIPDDTKEDALVRSVKISDAVQALVGNLTVTPAFVIAKGGITSSDVGTKALQVKKANVLGQIRPGIPVWQTGEESKFPKTPYVIFPGNVGETQTLKEAVEVLIS